MYDIPKQVRTPVRIGWIYFVDLIILASVFALLFIFKGIVHDKLLIPYYLVFMGIALGMILPSTFNPNKRIGESIYYAWVRKRNTFHAL